MPGGQKPRSLKALAVSSSGGSNMRSRLSVTRRMCVRDPGVLRDEDKLPSPRRDISSNECVSGRRAASQVFAGRMRTTK